MKKYDIILMICIILRQQTEFIIDNHYHKLNNLIKC